MSQRKVLLAWELGGNLGHVSRLLAVVKMVEEAGAQPILALPAHAMNSPWLRHVTCARRQAPQQVVVSDKVDVLSYASILLNIGFANVAGVARAIGDWRRLFAEVQPDQVVLDTAPMAQFAACLDGWPALRISNGFDSPPPSCPTFGIGLRGPYIERINANHIERLNESLAQAAVLAGRLPSTLHEYLTYPTRYFDAIAQTDPHGPRDDVTYVGPLIGLPVREPMAWPGPARSGRKRVLAYLRGSFLVEAVLEALARERAEVICVGDEALASDRRWAARSIQVTTSPVDLGTAAHAADLIVSNGSAGIVTVARLAGKPQLLVPSDVEKMVVAQRIEAGGAAKVVTNAKQADSALQQALRLPVLKAIDVPTHGPLVRHLSALPKEQEWTPMLASAR